MTITHIIMVVGIVVSTIVALLVASQQRRQMRQIELFKQNPAVGLVPPPTALTKFIKSNWDAILGFGLPSLNLIIIFSSDVPLTRLSVLLISFSVALLLANVVLVITFRLLANVISLISDLKDVVRDHVELTESSVRAIKKLANCQTSEDSQTA